MLLYKCDIIMKIDQITSFKYTMSYINYHDTDIDMDSDIDRFLHLQRIINTPRINHKDNILTSETLKCAYIYCKLHNIPSQVCGSLIEHYIISKFGMTKNNSSLCIGDANYGGINIEIKSSSTICNTFNFNNIRPRHSCDYLLSTFYINDQNKYDMGKLYVFMIGKSDMLDLILQYGSYSHGTKMMLGPLTRSKLHDTTNNTEYSIKLKLDSNCWHDLMRFRIYIL